MTDKNEKKRLTIWANIGVWGPVIFTSILFGSIYYSQGRLAEEWEHVLKIELNYGIFALTTCLCIDLYSTIQVFKVMGASLISREFVESLNLPLWISGVIELILFCLLLKSVWMLLANVAYWLIWSLFSFLWRKIKNWFFYL